MRYRAAVIILAFIGLIGLPSSLIAEDFTEVYNEYFPTPNCEEPQATQGNRSHQWCEDMYNKKGDYALFQCESEALFKQRTAPQLLQQTDVKWLANAVNRKKACMDLLANKGKLGLWDTFSRWWNSR